MPKVKWSIIGHPLELFLELFIYTFKSIDKKVKASTYVNHNEKHWDEEKCGYIELSHILSDSTHLS